MARRRGKEQEASLSFIQHLLIEPEHEASCQVLGELVEKKGLLPALKKHWFWFVCVCRGLGGAVCR